MNNLQQNKTNKRQGQIWLYCHKCGKKLAKQLPNGVIEFAYGLNRFDKTSEPKVKIRIWGSMQMKCLNPECSASVCFSVLPKSEENLT